MKFVIFTYLFLGWVWVALGFYSGEPFWFVCAFIYMACGAGFYAHEVWVKRAAIKSRKERS